jgi:hypothetical protein
MSRSVLSGLLLVAALMGWWITTDAGRAAKTRLAAAALVLAALIGHLNVLRMPSNVLVLRLPEPHYHDMLHYYLGTKYFAELGYTGLYAAVVRADFEDARASFDPIAPVRDLSRNELIMRARAVDGAIAVPAMFGPERWEAFKRDVAVFRGAIPPDQWRALVTDHGYNGTPLVTALLGAIARQPWMPTGPFVSWASTADLLLIAAFAAFLLTRDGWALAAAFLFFTFANPLNEYGFVGGSYLRYCYFVALAAAVFALRRKRLVAGGIWLAAAGWLRIFPLAIYGFLLLRDLASRDWRDRLRSNARLHLAFACATLAIFGATTFAVSEPDRRNPWLAFADKITAHADSSGINQVFLGVPLTYSPAVDRLHGGFRRDEANKLDTKGDWAAAAAQVRRERVWLVFAAAIGLVGLSIAALRRTRGAAVLLPSLLAVFCVMPMTSYDWVVLSLVPLAFWDEAGTDRGLLLLFAALALTAMRSLPIGFDLRYSLLSIEVLAYLVLSCAAPWRTGRALREANA